jgi:hypothetical protein
MADDDAGDLTARLQATNQDQPPAGLLAAARAAFSWRTLDTDLCRPSYDSLLDEALSPVRGGQDARLLRFELGDLALDLEVTPEGEGRTLVGQVTPPGPTELTVRHGGAVETTVGSDELGRFVLDGVRPGPLSVRCATAGDATLYTDWVLI